MIQRIDFLKQFSQRLREAMISAGYSSSRSPSGVNIHKLAEITGYSSQICRKYLRGEVIPELAMLTEIADKLSVSPGWLLFGDSHSNGVESENKITISKNLLHYIFSCASELYQDKQSEQEIPSFLLELTNDLSQMNTNEEQSKKIVDIAVSSAKHFTNSESSDAVLPLMA